LRRTSRLSSQRGLAASHVEPERRVRRIELTHGLEFVALDGVDEAVAQRTEVTVGHPQPPDVISAVRGWHHEALTTRGGAARGILREPGPDRREILRTGSGACGPARGLHEPPNENMLTARAAGVARRMGR
jgi:hypothetical protein